MASIKIVYLTLAFYIFYVKVGIWNTDAKIWWYLNEVG